jgi:hypothetical protein
MKIAYVFVSLKLFAFALLREGQFLANDSDKSKEKNI